MENTRSTKAEEGWIKATSLATLYQAGIFPLSRPFFDVWPCGLVVLCVLCAVCCFRCSVVARLNKTTLHILGIEVYNCVIR